MSTRLSVMLLFFAIVASAVAQVRLVRGPYLQCGSPTGMVVRWRTDVPCDSIVRYGTNAGALDAAQTNVTAITNHEVLITGLRADTKYFYAITSGSNVLARGDQFYFRTSPTATRPVRIWAIGDSGTADANAARVRDEYLGLSGSQHTDVWLMLGDNAYSSGTDDEYQHAVFEMYPQLLRRTVLWPALGNHDAGDAAPADPLNYLDTFTLPADAQAGGVPSGTELYYSFDYANIHFVCLDSFISEISTSSPMLTWLEQDLAATDKDWIIAYWHHPPYSWGTHNSDHDPILTNVRQRVLPILEHFGVDLVLCGHSHVYERSFLLDGHYGYSWNLARSMVVSRTLGRANDEDGPYYKPAGGLGAHRGTVYVVCGCSGQGGNNAFPLHPAMVLNRGGYGSTIIDVDGLRLTARFQRSDGDIDDHFTIDKSAPTLIRPEMEIARRTNAVLVSWPTSVPRYTLELSDVLPATNWQIGPHVPRTNGRNNTVLLPSDSEKRFFRLRSEP